MSTEPSVESDAAVERVTAYLNKHESWENYPGQRDLIAQIVSSDGQVALTVADLRLILTTILPPEKSSE